jgi:hypothetical protein
VVEGFKWANKASPGRCDSASFAPRRCQALDDLIEELFEGAEGRVGVDLDPVEAMAGRFRELVDEYLALLDRKGALFVCIDDVDRCLPDHQIAMLEAIHFLTAAGARAYFLVALDPRLVQ